MRVTHKILFMTGNKVEVRARVSPRILYCVVDTGYGLGGSLGDCRTVLPKGRKYQMVKTQTDSHVRRRVV